MKTLFVMLFACASANCYCQFNNSFSLVPSVNLNFEPKEIAYNSFGTGVGLDGLLFAKCKLQLLIEVSADKFFGDKTFVSSDQGRQNKTATIYAVKAGPQFFLTKHIALSTTAGPTWHSIKAVGFTQDYGLKFAIAGFLGSDRRFVTKFFIVDILTENMNIQYFGLQFGYRFN